MTKKTHWYRRFPDRFLNGTKGMGPVLGWAYTRLLEQIYADAAPVENDPQKLKFLLEMRPQDVRKVIPQLTDLGKIFIDRDNLIHNAVADDELKWRANGGSYPSHLQGHFPGIPPGIVAKNRMKTTRAHTIARDRPRKESIDTLSSTSQPLPEDDLPHADALGADPTGPPPSIPISDKLLNTKLVKKGH